MLQTHAPKTLFAAGTMTPDAALDLAEVCIQTGTTWHVYARGKHVSFSNYVERPSLPCPIVDISNLDEELDEQVADIMGAYHQAHVLADLLEGLSNLGATVTQRPCPLCISTPMNCITCTFGGLK